MTSAPVPKFGSSVIESKRTDGYWIETFQFSKKDKLPGVIASGLVSGLVEFLDNPLNTNKEANLITSEWPKYEIAKFDSPVAVVAVDVTQNGLTDVIICCDYGPFMLECNPDGGHIYWLENPGRDHLKDGKHWTQHYIGRWPAMHRMKAGYFTQRSFLELVAAPVVNGQHDKTTPIPIIRFQAPEDVEKAEHWPRDIIDDEHFTIIHDLSKKKFNGPSGLDSLLVASREGATWLHYEDGVWKRDLIGAGEPKEPRQSATSETPGSGDHWGTGGIDAGKVGDDPFAYVATLDPFHGTKVCAYTKVNRGIRGFEWKRHVLDTFGTPTQQTKTGDGPGHYMVCADFDGDGDDEILVSLFGPLDRDEEGAVDYETQFMRHPYKGIMYYKAIDLENGIFARWRIADESSARIAIADFNKNGRLDVASISYNVKNYYEEPDPVVTLHLSQFGQVKVPSIIGTVWENEGAVYIPDPAHLTGGTDPVSLLQVGDYDFSVVAYPPGGRITSAKGEGLKVLYGSLTPLDQPPEAPIRRPLGSEVFPHIESLETTGNGSFMTDPEKGAIVLRLKSVEVSAGPWPSADKVPVKTTFKPGYGLQLPDLRFVKVESLWWGARFHGDDFYNLSGFHFHLLDGTQIAHMQFWTAGQRVNCRFHNHSDNIFEELHTCLSQGTVDEKKSQTKSKLKGGMWVPKPEYEDCTADELDDLQASDPDAFVRTELGPLQEHGAIWHVDSKGEALRGRNNVVSYPWHSWRAGDGVCVDLWMALEFNADLDLGGVKLE